MSGIVGISAEKKIREPNIEFDHDEWNFGKINEGEKISHIFRVKNTGDANLIIKRIKASCKCTATEISSKVIKPGKKVKVKVSYDSEEYRGMVTRTVTVESNDPDNMAKVFFIRGEVKPQFPEINMSLKIDEMKFQVVPGKKTVQKFAIKNNSHDNITINRISTSLMQYEASFPSDVIAPRGKLPISLKFKPEAKGANTTDYIYLEIAIPFTTEPKK
jgi:hypothetical protein